MTAPTPQQLSTALSLVDRSTWPSSFSEILNHVRAYTIDVELVGREGLLKASAATIATRVGLSRGTVHRALERLVKIRVLNRPEKARGSGSSLWAINGNFVEWDVRWRRDRQVVIQHLALLCVAPHVATQHLVCVATHSATQTPDDAPQPRLVAHESGDFVSRPGSRHESDLFVALMAATSGDDATPATPLLVDLTSTSEANGNSQEEQRISRPAPTPATAEVLSAIREVTSHELIDGKHPARSQVLDALAPLSPPHSVWIASEIRRARNPMWMQNVAMVERLAAGPAPWEPGGAPPASPHRILAEITRLELEADAAICDPDTTQEQLDAMYAEIEVLRREAGACENGPVTTGGAQ